MSSVIPRNRILDARRIFCCSVCGVTKNSLFSMFLHCFHEHTCRSDSLSTRKNKAFLVSGRAETFIYRD